MLVTADHLNRTLPARHEIETAVRHLAGAGLITVDAEGWFRVTPAGERLWRTRPHGGLGTTVDTVYGVLNRRHTPGDHEWVLDEREHAAAVQEYTARLLPTPRRSPENAVRSAGAQRSTGSAGTDA